MLNSNFDLRTFLAESKAPTEQVNEATLTEATVMEYIREKMDHMNNEVRSCMREYLNAVNEIDPGHEDAHAQLMGALEDFYNKLKAHFEEDEAHMEEPLDTNTDVPAIALEEGEEEDEHSFGDEGDAPEVKEGLLDRLKKKPAQSSPAPAKVLSADEIQAMIDAEAETGTIVDILDAAVVQQTIDLTNATPEQIKMFVSVARKGDTTGDTVTGDNYMSYLEKLPNYSKVNEEASINEDVDPLLLQGLAKTVLHVAAVPGFMAVLYKLKDTKKFGPAIQKMITALEKFHD